MHEFLTRAAAAVCFAATTPSAAVAGADELDRFAGVWTSPGTLLATPYSKAGSATATTTCAWSAGRYFMICQQTIVSGSGSDHVLSVYTYDAAKHGYAFYHIGADGGGSSDIAIAGDTVIYSNTFTDRGNRVTIRTLNVWQNARRYNWRTEYTTDGGATWSPMASGSAAKR